MPIKSEKQEEQETETEDEEFGTPAEKKKKKEINCIILYAVFGYKEIQAINIDVPIVRILWGINGTLL